LNERNRQQAGSYRDRVHTVKMIVSTRVKIVGASLLAMDVNDDAGCLDECGVRAFFASKLAPTGDPRTLLIFTTH
jgi:hypothetical protein